MLLSGTLAANPQKSRVVKSGGSLQANPLLIAVIVAGGRIPHSARYCRRQACRDGYYADRSRPCRESWPARISHGRAVALPSRGRKTLLSDNDDRWRVGGLRSLGAVAAVNQHHFAAPAHRTPSSAPSHI